MQIRHLNVRLSHYKSDQTEIHSAILSNCICYLLIQALVLHILAEQKFLIYQIFLFVISLKNLKLLLQVDLNKENLIVI